MEQGVPRRRRPRPVVSAGLESLSSRSEELAKSWLVALVEDAPLEAAAAILAGDVARDGPRICDAVVRAIYDDADLRRIERDGVLEPLASRVGELAGAGDVVAAAHAVETLKDVVWGALRRELGPDDPELLVEAAERLSLVTELVRSAVLRRGVVGDAPVDGLERRAPLRVAAEPPDRAGATVERRGVPGLEGRQGSSGVGGAAADGGRFAEGRAGSGEESERDALWVGALHDEIARAGRARVPLSVLLVELEEAEKLLAIEPHAEASATFGRFAQAVRGSVRRRDVLAAESDSRAWIIARDTGRAGAQALGSRIAETVSSEGSWRGAPLTVSVGLAVLGEDGHNASSLIEAAEQTRFAAEASGIGIVTGEPDDGDGELPDPGLAG
jgi:GGDEF domain-containing protein